MLATYAFPFRLDKTGKPIVLTHAESLAQRVRMLIHTGIGTLYFMRTEGTTLPLLLNGPNDLSIVEVALSQTKIMIERQETRVKDVKLSLIERGTEYIAVSVSYANNLTNTEDSFTTTIRK